jgi:hypothetical protein
VPCPPPSTWFIEAKLIQPSARIRFEVIHHSFRLSLGSDDYMNVIRSDVCCEQAPTALTAALD